MQTAIPYKIHVDAFPQILTQFADIINFDIVFAPSEQPRHSGLF